MTGVIVPPRGFIRGVRELCGRFGAPRIFDGAAAGVGQTGTMLACEYEGAKPDIPVTGKALASGRIPGSAVMRRDVGEAMSAVRLHGYTRSCCPLMCRAALKTLEIIRREEPAKDSRVVGDCLHGKLLKLEKCYHRFYSGSSPRSDILFWA